MADDAAALRETLDRQLARVAPGDAWRTLVEAGVAGLVIAEDLGGLGLTIADAAPILEAIGAHGVATPFIETAIVAATLLQQHRTPAADAALRAIVAGERVAVAGLDPRLRPNVSATPTDCGWRLNGDALLVLDPDAAHILVAARTEGSSDALLLVAGGADGLHARSYATIDGRSAADMRFINVDAVLLATELDDDLTAAGDAALACIATEAAAVMRRLVEDTIAYTKQREQFGQPIARFQALQHRMVDMHIEGRRAAAIAARAMGALDGNRAERGRIASAAKATVADSGRFVGQNAVQLHGGMGMTEELPVARLFRRLTVIEHELGSADQHRQRYARMASPAAG